MLPASQNAQRNRFLTGENSRPDFQQIATDAASYLAAGTSFFIAVIIFSRRLAGGITSQPSSSLLLLLAIIGGGLIAAANGAWSERPPSSLWMMTITRCSVLITLISIGIWLPLFSAFSFATTTLAAAIAFLPARHPRNGKLPHNSTFPYWTAATELQQTFRKKTLNFLRIGQAKPKPSIEKTTPPFSLWETLRNKKQDAKQLVPLKQLLDEQVIVRPTEKHHSGAEDTLLQWQERYELPDGTEYLCGQLMIAFSPGSRVTTGHVGFCPAFQKTPIVEVTTNYDALEVSVTVAEILPWGIRIECRVEEPIDECTAIPVSLSVNKPLGSNTSFTPHK